MRMEDAKGGFVGPLHTPSNLGSNATKDIAAALTMLLADVFALYIKTKNFHWHISGPHFRDYHLLLDEQAGQILEMTDDIAERARKIGGTTIRSIGHIARLQPSGTMMRISSRPKKCWPSSRKTIWRSPSTCGKPTMSATSMATSRRPA